VGHQGKPQGFRKSDSPGFFEVLPRVRGEVSFTYFSCLPSLSTGERYRFNSFNENLSRKR
jgi:hypothetical protein